MSDVSISKSPEQCQDDQRSWLQKPGSGGLDRQLVLLAAAHGLDEPEPRVISSRGDPRVRRAVEYLQINAFFMFYKQTKRLLYFLRWRILFFRKRVINKLRLFRGLK